MENHLQLRLKISGPHRNQYLFSDHYLENILPNDPRWESALSEAQDFLAWLKDLYASEQKQLSKYNEEQLEDRWLRPILRKLGHVFERQASVPGLEAGVKRPDYVFFPDEATRQAAVSAQKTEAYTSEALVVGEVKRWGVSLSKKQKGGGASFEAQNPSWQIDYYIRATGLDWGILTDGRLWRLVHHTSSHRLSIYYEVDLEDLLRQGDAGAMRYFTLFFRQAAFRPDVQGRVFLQNALDASEAYAIALEEDLEQNVYRALERLMQGFLDLPQNGLGAGDLRTIYENSLYLLYRLLFILYGESRGLLPLHMSSYRDNYSLDKIKREITGLSIKPDTMTTLYWGRLKNLFQIINGDNVALNRRLGVPRYNGGLFDPQQHPFFENYAVGDRALVEAIDLISRRQSDQGREFVDYRTLSVRHLGSIYEGLLEYQPRYADEPVAAVGDEWLKASDVPEGANVIERREAGEIYLETDRGERKATGSYYTPQYIVEYIVQNTLGPLVEEARERVRTRAKAAKSKAKQAEAAQAFVDEVLDLKVLDPAMGSGHFLVEATDYLALALTTDPYVKIEDDSAIEEDLTHWKRRVVERCIYGVDRNPLAVELAKLSLWLATVAVDKPLSFLDHHLKSGDSLVGARVADLGWAPPPLLSKKAQKQIEQQKAGQMNLFEYALRQKLPDVISRILEITEVESDSYETVQAKEAADEAVRELKKPFEAVANLWTSGYFGNEFTQGDYDEALGVISHPDTLLGLEVVERAQAMADELCFFHWELAFPEVFYDEYGQPLGERAGFDVVTGNPPYVSSRNEVFYAEAKIFVDNRYEVAFYQVDLYYLFLEQSANFTNIGGIWSFIIPDTWVASVKAENVRQWLTRFNLVLSIALPGEQVFDADVDCLVIVCKRQVPTESEKLTEVYLISKDQTVLERSLVLPSSGEVFPLLGHASLLAKIAAGCVVLDDIALTGRGIGAYHHSKHSQEIIENRAFHADYKKGEDFLPELGGGNIRRYEVIWQGDRWIKYGNWLSEPRDPCLFQGNRVLVRKILGGRLCCTFTDSDWLVDQQVYVAAQFQNSYSALYATGILASSLMGFYSRKKFHEESLFPHLRVTQFRELPLRRIDFTTPADEREKLFNEARARAQDVIKALAASNAVVSDTPMDQVILAQTAAPVFSFVEERIDQEPERADVIHDLLAHLAEQMISMNKEKQDSIEAFWLDLEGVTEADTFEDLKEHGKWESSLWKAKACRPFVDEESRSTRHLDESLAWNEDCFRAFVKMLAGRIANLSDVVSVYRKHHPAYRQLVQRIESTDWLIDQIVYRLYGLTEEEIAIVEGGS